MRAKIAWLADENTNGVPPMTAIGLPAEELGTVIVGETMSIETLWKQ